jgi:hypothetical protein
MVSSQKNEIVGVFNCGKGVARIGLVACLKNQLFLMNFLRKLIQLIYEILF